MQTQTAFDAGFQAGRAWVGPEFDGSMGSGSWAFIEEQAERFACGREFRDLRDGPTEGERAIFQEWMAGFRAGWRIAA